MNINLRDYQNECIDILDGKGKGRYLVQMATGLGKTVTFANLKRKGRMLILSHREELVRQPLKYFQCSTGIEMAAQRSQGEEVVSASVQSIVHRLDRFKPDEFDMIIVDEAHHSAAKTYRKVLEHFTPRQLIGFTATPNRADKARLNDIFDEIVFKRDLKWGIKNGYLCDIDCKRVNIGYDLRAVHTRGGDYAPGELSEAMSGTEDAIAESYTTMSKGATLIFAASVAHAEAIAERIPESVVITGKTKNRQDIIQQFTERKIPCLINCMVFTEGTDIPLVETVIIARPTQSDSLYAQMVGRGLRLHPDKDRLTLIDCVGVTGRRSLCTAPSLLGIDISELPQKKQDSIEGDLFELPEKIERAADNPSSWIKNIEIVNLWAQQQQYNLHDINFFQMPDGRLKCSLPERKMLVVPCPDELGNVTYNGSYMDLQSAVDMVYTELCENYSGSEYIWNLEKAKKWGKYPASDAQVKLIRRKCRNEDIDYDSLTKLQASQILNRVMGG
ncbi:MAG: DEAD/DEAH box helicase [Ruminococcus sp.]|nr:DEAD/DEAH box helicase [Ruminococcus sp.]